VQFFNNLFIIVAPVVFFVGVVGSLILLEKE